MSSYTKMNSGRFWTSWYSSRRWQSMRAQLFARSPYCIYCKKREGRVIKATIADHIVPHKGNKSLFWDEENLQPLCKKCHDSDKAREEAGGKAAVRFGADGYPLKVPGGE